MATPTWTINVSDIRTVRVNNISLTVSERDIKEFFSFSGDIQYVEMRSESETTQLAYVTFKDTQGADTAILLSGAVIGNLSVSITPVDDYDLPPEALFGSHEKNLAVAGPVVQKAEDVMSSMLAKGFILGKDAINKAKALDERHHLILNASATVASIDSKIGLSEKLTVGKAAVKEMDERYQVSEMTRSAFAVAEQKASDASTAVMSNRYVSAGASWVSGALSAFAKAAGDVGAMTKEKVERAEEEKKESVYNERTGIVADFAKVHLDESPTALMPVSSADDNRLAIL